MAHDRTLLNTYLASACRGPFDKMVSDISCFLLDKTEADQKKAIDAWKAQYKETVTKQKAAVDARAAALAAQLSKL